MGIFEISKAGWGDSTDFTRFEGGIVSGFGEPGSRLSRNDSGSRAHWFSFWTSNFSGKAVYTEAVFGKSSKCIIVENNSLVTWFSNSIKLILFVFKILPMWSMWNGTQLSAEHLYFEMCVCICTTHPVPQTPPINWDSAGELASRFFWHVKIWRALMFIYEWHL